MPHDTYQSRHQITAMTFDTSSCRDDYRARLDVMTHELKIQAPDLLLLQNVFATADNRFNTAAHIAQALHMNCAFLPMRPKMRYLDGRPTESHSGLAVLSRHQIVDSRRVELPCDSRDGQRLAQFADLAIDGTRLLVANIQVTHMAGAEAARRHQIEKLAELVGHAHDFDHILVGGDFNASPVDPALDPLRQTPNFSVAEVGPGRGVDRLFALSRISANRPTSLIALNDARSELDRVDPKTHLFPGDRAALACDMVLNAVPMRISTPGSYAAAFGIAAE